MDPKTMIEQAFPGNTVRRGRSLYVERAKALDVVRLCRKWGIAILGFEGFAREGPRIHPHLDLIADFSEIEAEPWDNYVAACARSAELVLLHWPYESDLLVTFVLKAGGT